MSIYRRANALLKSRQGLSRLFQDTLFSDPALTILLDLLVCEGEGKYVTIGNCCVAAGIPQTTALRYISGMAQKGLLRRRPHPTDGRSTIIEIQPAARLALVDWIEETTRLLFGDAAKSPAPGCVSGTQAAAPNTASPS